MREEGGPMVMGGARSNPLFRRIFGDAFPSTSALAIDLCNRGEVNNASQMIHLGSGMGSVSSLISGRFGCTISGVESLPIMVENANADWAKDSVEFQCSPLHSAPFPDAWATHLLTESRLSVSRQPETILAEARRLLCDGGILMNSELVISDSSLLEDKVKLFMDNIFGSESDLSISGWVTLLETNGFHVIESREEQRVMLSNRAKMKKALFGTRLLRKMGRLSLSDFGLESLEEDFDAIANSALMAIDAGIISYGSFISKSQSFAI